MNHSYIGIYHYFDQKWDIMVVRTNYNDMKSYVIHLGVIHYKTKMAARVGIIKLQIIILKV